MSRSSLTTRAYEPQQLSKYLGLDERQANIPLYEPKSNEVRPRSPLMHVKGCHTRGATSQHFAYVSRERQRTPSIRPQFHLTKSVREYRRTWRIRRCRTLSSYCKPNFSKAIDRIKKKGGKLLPNKKNTHNYQAVLPPTPRNAHFS